MGFPFIVHHLRSFFTLVSGMFLKKMTTFSSQLTFQSECFFVEAFLEGEHRAMIQSMRTQGEAEYIPGVNTEVDAPAQVTVQRQQEVVEGATKS